MRKTMSAQPKRSSLAAIAKNGASGTQSLRAAQAAGLRYVTDAIPGIRRRSVRGGFAYTNTNGRPVRDSATLQRIRSLVIPPAWRDVWICPLEHGHLQVTGRDARGRKQYRYHARWREVRDKDKYGSLATFARALPKLRERVAADLRLPGLPRRKVLAAVVSLLEFTLARVGNERYARDNGSFGLTTLRDRHVEVRGERIRLHFRGKSGKWHDIELADRRLARIVQRCRDLPGQELFQYLDEHGDAHSVDSSDVNEYLRALTGCDYTAKDFRTWAGTVSAVLALCVHSPFKSLTEAKRNVKRAMELVAGRLGNTVSVCRKSYVHPVVINAYMSGRLGEALERLRKRLGALTGDPLRDCEIDVLRLLQIKVTRRTEIMPKRAPKPNRTHAAPGPSGKKRALRGRHPVRRSPRVSTHSSVSPSR